MQSKPHCREEKRNNKVGGNMTTAEMKEEEPELIGKTYDELFDGDREYFSNCCGAHLNDYWLLKEICPQCFEHCKAVKEIENDH